MRRAAIALLLFVLACADGSGGGPERGSPGGDEAVSTGQAVPAGPTRVLVYGDSLWDKGSNPDDCDLCRRLPDDVQVTNFAKSGAEIWTQRLCDGLDPDGTPNPTADPHCRNGIDRALPAPLHADPALDVCAAQVAGRPTCIRDNPDSDVLLLQFGTNDVRSADIAEDAVWQERVRDYEESLYAILEERPPGMACVLVVPPPIWSEGFEVFNERLDELAEILYAAADVHACEVADLFGLYMQFEVDAGPGATLPLYENCASQGAAEGDCVHYAIPRPTAPAEEILRAIDRAAGLGGLP